MIRTYQVLWVVFCTNAVVRSKITIDTKTSGKCMVQSNDTDTAFSWYRSPDQSPENLAYMRSATQSTTKNNHSASLAVDSDPTTCAETSDNGGWWHLQLTNYTLVTRVDVRSAADDQPVSNLGVNVYVGYSSDNADDNYSTCKSFSNGMQPLERVTCSNGPECVTMIRIQMSAVGGKPLRLCDVKVYGSTGPVTRRYYSSARGFSLQCYAPPSGVLDASDYAAGQFAYSEHSLANTSVFGSAPAYGVDGLSSTCFKSQFKGGYWEVDLIRPVTVSTITLQLGNVEPTFIYVGHRNSSGFWFALCRNLTTVTTSLTNITCLAPVCGTRIRVAQPAATTPLTVCDLRVLRALNSQPVKDDVPHSMPHNSSIISSCSRVAPSAVTLLLCWTIA